MKDIKDMTDEELVTGIVTAARQDNAWRLDDGCIICPIFNKFIKEYKEVKDAVHGK